MGLRSRNARRSAAAMLPVLALCLLGGAAGHAASKLAYQRFKPGMSTGPAFRSLLRSKEVNRTYARERRDWGGAERRSRGLVNAAMVPVALSYIGMGGIQTVTNGAFLAEAIARGNPWEIGAGAVMTVITGGFTAANAWFAKVNILSAKAEFSSAQSAKRDAQRATIDSVLSDSRLQRSINGGHPLSPQGLQSLAALRAAL